MPDREFTAGQGEIIAAKRLALAERKAKTPIEAVRALASMQKRPLPVLNTVTNDSRVILMGQIKYSPTADGTVGPGYDPVGVSMRYAREGVDAIALFTDETIYSGGLDDLMFVSRAVRVPVISQDYILEEYQIVEARAAGASAIVLSASVLEQPTLRSLVSATQRNRMTAIVEVSDLDQLERVNTFSPQVIALNSTDPTTHRVNVDLMCTLRPMIPHQTSVMISCGLTTLEEVAAVVKVGVNAVLISERLLARVDTLLRLKTLLKHPFQENAE